MWFVHRESMATDGYVHYDFKGIALGNNSPERGGWTVKHHTQMGTLPVVKESDPDKSL